MNNFVNKLSNLYTNDGGKIKKVEMKRFFVCMVSSILLGTSSWGVEPFPSVLEETAPPPLREVTTLSPYQEAGKEVSTAVRSAPSQRASMREEQPYCIGRSECIFYHHGENLPQAAVDEWPSGEEEIETQRVVREASEGPQQVSQPQARATETESSNLSLEGEEIERPKRRKRCSFFRSAGSAQNAGWWTRLQHFFSPPLEIIEPTKVKEPV